MATAGSEEGIGGDQPSRGLSRRDFLAGSAAAVALPAVLKQGRLPAAGAAPIPDVAAVTLDGDGLLGSIRATRPAEVMLRAWPTGFPLIAQETPWQPTNAANVAKLPLPSAGGPGLGWSWQGFVRDPLNPTAPPVADIVRSIPARPATGLSSTFTFAFGCCTIRNLGTAFRVVRQANPQFFAMIGDFGYPDRPTTANPVAQNYGGYVRAFADVLRHERMTPILASAPLFPMGDDHDYGRDNCNRTTAQPWAGQAFADLMPGGAYPDPNYRSWSVGDVDFFITDNRRWKDPDLGPFENGRYMSVLGSAQRDWLLQGMANSTARLKCVFIPMTMAWYWSRAEATEVRRFISDHVTGAVIFLSGDKHAGAFARYTPRIWEFLAAPMYNSAKHKTPSRSTAVIWTENGTGAALYNAVGLVDVDTATTNTCTLRLVREDGVELHREIVALPPV